jgi:hypothetical protein
MAAIHEPQTSSPSLETLELENAQLKQALESRIVIEQAKGVLAERYRVGVGEAFELLRRAARSNRIPLHALAEAVAPATPTPPEIEDVVYRARGLPLTNGSGPPRNR